MTPDVTDDTPIWRYMDLPKFAFTIATRRLWFPKVSTLHDDPYEAFCTAVHPQMPVNDMGPKSVVHTDTMGTRRRISVEEMNVNVASASSRSFEGAPEQVFVNCWCLGPESMAMWKIYGSLAFGVAIKSTVGHYKRALQWGEIRPEQYTFGPVQYHPDLKSVSELQRDFSQGSIPMSSALWQAILRTAFHKRSCYAYEIEWRAALYQMYGPDIKGVGIPFDPNELIGEVYLGPRAEAFFFHTVLLMMEKFGIDKPFGKSQLLTPPRKDTATA